MPLPSSDQSHVQFNSAPPSSSTDEVIDAKCDENSDVALSTNVPVPPPTVCRAQSPKTRHEPPAATANRMKQHNVIETLLKSTSTSPPSISMSTNEETPRDANESRDDTKDKMNRSSKKKHFNSKQHKHQHQQQQRKNSSAASLVVCGVDGTVFTLDAYTGQLRGMFTSGPALVFSSDAVRDKDVDDMDVDESTGSIIQAPRPWKERVVPGLDGRLYSLYEHTDQNDYDDEEDYVSECKAGSGNDDFLDELCNSLDEDDHDHYNEDYSSSSVTPKMDRYNLQPLPISIMDVVDSPISTCRPNMNFDEASEGVQKRQCGIVVGSKKTTIYAIDPTTGKVRWTQDPHGARGAKGYTTGRPADDGTKPTVLLQREDYAARHLDTDGGDEVWKVELGRFSALDFDIDAHQQNMDEDNDDPIVVGGTGRGAAAAAATKDIKDKQRAKIPPILAGRSKKFGSVRDDSAEFESDDFAFNYEQSSMYRSFPSIAFGEDGTSVLAVDSISGELLWKRQIESVVAAVYGVGKASTWIPLDVVDESEVLTHGHQQAASFLPSSSTSLSSHNSGGLIPYGANNLLADQTHRLGRHKDHLFVSSKYDPLGINPPPFPDSGIMDNTPSVDDAPNYIGEHSDVYEEILHPPKQAPLSSHVPYSMPVDVTPPVSHRTEHGLYLTWSMISIIMVLLLSVIVCARLYYLRQKRKWENTPTLAPATAPNSHENEASDQPMSPRGNFLTSTIFADEKGSFPGNSWNDISTQPPARSLSMGAIGKQAELSGTSFIPDKSKDSSAALSPKPDSTSVFRQGKEVHSLVGALTTTPPTVTRSLTVPADEEPKQPDLADEVDGVPLVRYSRYRSEFQELSALGRGGFGTVFKCENNLDSREYAIKKIWIKSQITDGKLATKNFSQRLHRVLREVKILALLDHPNIVRYYTAWLEVDNEDTKPDDCESNMTSSRASPSIFSALGSASRGHSLIFKAGGNLFSSYMPKSNPLGWNNFASFQLDESKSTSKLPNVNENTVPSSDASHDDDLGFVWERSGENSLAWSSPVKQAMYPMEHDLKEENEESSSDPSSVSSVETKESTEGNVNPNNLDAKWNNHSEGKHDEADNNTSDKKAPTFITERRHVLYIQMQLCSVQTLADFLGNRQARVGPAGGSSTNCYAVDIPYALRLFSQITHGVKYVHKQGLIHRDLKPQNCFIDDAGIAKVGDFGLSRESSAVGGISGTFDESDMNNDTHAIDVNTLEDPYGGDAENTAGVGTRAYASPEQMKGSNYDASTDIYSLGIILFEMCYPLYTTHERYKEFCGIRKGQFPSYWNSNIKIAFPSLHDLLTRMLSPISAHRPSAADVSEHIDKMLAEYSIQSLDKSWGKRGAILLRVEADEAEGVLSATMKLIKAAAPHAVILQYGLRGQTSKAIMEFAIEINHEEETSMDRISFSLRNSKMIVRQISNY